MSNIVYICKMAAHTIRKYDKTDPFRLAAAMHIVLLYESMGASDSACKGFYIFQSRKHVITINDDLSYEDQYIVLSHEIGHAVLHWQLAKSEPLREYSLYNQSSQMENDANYFAAEFLVSDDKVIECFDDGQDFFAAAKSLYVPPEMLDYKIRIMSEKGYEINAPFMANSNFLKNITRNDRF